MIRFTLPSPRRICILAVGTLITSLAVSAWAWQLPGGVETESSLPVPGPPESEPGARADQLPQPIFTNRSTFRIPFQFDQEEIQPGAVFSFQNGDGEMPGVVTAVETEQVIVDFNHPLSGRNIVFKVDIVDLSADTVH